MFQPQGFQDPGFPLSEMTSKYPPGKAGGFNICEPLKAAIIGSLTRPRFLGPPYRWPVNATDSSGPDAHLPAPDSECTRVSPSRLVPPSTQNTLVPRSAVQQNFASSHHTPWLDISRSCP